MKLFQKTREPENKDNDQESILSQHSQNAEKEMVAMLLCCSYNPNRNAIKNYLEIPHSGLVFYTSKYENFYRFRWGQV